MAAGEAEVGRLLVRLRGDGTSYKKMLDEANRATTKYTRGIDGKLRDAQGRFVTDQQRMQLALSQTNKRLARLGIRLKYAAAGYAALGTRMRSVGRSMTLRLTTPIVLMGTASAKAFASFDKAMTESTSIMKVTETQIKRMRETALSLGTQGIQGPAELARSYFYLASAGKDAEQSMALLPKVAQFATAGAFDMALATDLLTDAQSALGLSTKNVAQDTKNLVRVSDVLVKANTLANASVQQFSIALTSKAGAALKAYNKDVEEGVAVLAALADQGVKAELAGNALDRVIRLASKGAIDNAKAHKKLGFEVFDSSGKMKNLGDMVADLENTLEGLSDEQRAVALDMLGFQARVQGVILPLLGTSEAIKRYEEELHKAGGTTEEVAKKQLKSFSAQMRIFWNQIKEAGIQIGRVLSPWINKLTGLIKSLIKWMKGLNETVQKWILGTVALTAVLGPLLIVVGSLGVALPILATGVTAVGIAMHVALPHIVAVEAAILAVIGVYELFKRTPKPTAEEIWGKIPEGRYLFTPGGKKVKPEAKDTPQVYQGQGPFLPSPGEMEQTRRQAAVREFQKAQDEQQKALRNQKQLNALIKGAKVQQAADEWAFELEQAMVDSQDAMEATEKRVESLSKTIRRSFGDMINWFGKLRREKQRSIAGEDIQILRRGSAEAMARLHAFQGAQRAPFRAGAGGGMQMGGVGEAIATEMGKRLGIFSNEATDALREMRDVIVEHFGDVRAEVIFGPAELE